MFATVMSLGLPMCILISCSSVLCVLMAFGMFMLCRCCYSPSTTRVCRKSASRPGYVVKVRTDPGYVVKQCPRIVMNKIFDWH